MEQTNFNTIFKQIRNRLTVDTKIGCIGNQFVADMLAYRVTVSYRLLRRQKIIKKENVIGSLIKFYALTSISETFAEDNGAMDDLTLMMTKPLVKIIWKIDRERIRHGFESWFTQGEK